MSTCGKSVRDRRIGRLECMRNTKTCTCLSFALLVIVGCVDDGNSTNEQVVHLDSQDAAIKFQEYSVLISQSEDVPKIIVLEGEEIIHGIDLEKGRSKVSTHRYENNTVRIYFDSNGDGVLDEERVIERTPRN